MKPKIVTLIAHYLVPAGTESRENGRVSTEDVVFFGTPLTFAYDGEAQVLRNSTPSYLEQADRMLAHPECIEVLVSYTEVDSVISNTLTEESI